MSRWKKAIKVKNFNVLHQCKDKSKVNMKGEKWRDSNIQEIKISQEKENIGNTEKSDIEIFLAQTMKKPETKLRSVILLLVKFVTKRDFRYFIGRGHII